MSLRQLNYFFAILSLLLAFIAFSATFDGRSDIAMSSDELALPSLRYWLGTNDLGQDLLLRTWLATPDTLLIAFATGIFAPLLALIYALLMALGRKKLRQFLLRIIDIQLALPSFLLVILLAAYLQPSTFLLIIMLIILEWSRDVRELYALTDLEVKRDSFRQAQQFGASFTYLLHRHLLPRILPNFATICINVSRRTVLHAAGLAFLGITDPSKPTWGGMIADVIPLLYTPQAITLIIAPTLALVALMSWLTLAGYLLERQLFYSRQGESND